MNYREKIAEKALETLVAGTLGGIGLAILAIWKWVPKTWFVTLDNSIPKTVTWAALGIAILLNLLTVACWLLLRTQSKTKVLLLEGSKSDLETKGLQTEKETQRLLGIITEQHHANEALKYDLLTSRNRVLNLEDQIKKLTEVTALDMGKTAILLELAEHISLTASELKDIVPQSKLLMEYNLDFLTKHQYVNDKKRYDHQEGEYVITPKGRAYLVETAPSLLPSSHAE